MTRRQIPPAPPGARSLKRDPALVSLSRDHHGALVQALTLRRAARGGSRAAAVPAARAFLAFVEDELRGHFADEEAVVLPAADSVAPEESSRVRAEHRELEQLWERLRAALSRDRELRELLGEIGDLIHDHVRFEERALYERLQERLAPGEMEALGRALEEHRQGRGRGPGCALP